MSGSAFLYTYHFPGERASCYTTDLLLRQYKRVHDERRDKFSYKDLAPVYTIIIMEKSPHIFSEFPDEYKHYIYGTSDTGIKLNLLENIIFVNVDIFLNKLHNDGINTKLEAWLTFLGCDEPAYIVELITKYPEFKPLYSHLYDMCRNIEGVMNMFSKELQLMDRNTVKYMIDEYQEKLDAVKEELNTTTEELNSTTEQLNSTTEQLNSTTEQLSTAQTTISEKDNVIANLNSIIDKLQKEIDDLKNKK